VWHGLDDQFAPIEHGQWLAENIPGAQAELRDGDGHLRVAANRIDEVHEWLAQHLEQDPPALLCSGRGTSRQPNWVPE
jgi:pimeloyl-ACP methyl ester carboxylesterase